MTAIPLILILIFSIVFHEVAHAWAARREGDDTAERLGRVTLNPIPHLDPMGSLVVPALLYFLGTGVILGWAKPVPVNPANYRSPVWGDIRVSMAGIVVNLLLAVAFAMALVPVAYLTDPLQPGPIRTVVAMFSFGIYINLVLAFFNLIPIPPLDGSHVLKYLLPRGLRQAYEGVGQFGILILMALMYLAPQGFSMFLLPVDILTDALFTVFGLSGRL